MRDIEFLDDDVKVAEKAQPVALFRGDSSSSALYTSPSRLFSSSLLLFVPVIDSVISPILSVRFPSALGGDARRTLS
jgi:hypothetical protein